jgi:hypothetical protein
MNIVDKASTKLRRALGITLLEDAIVRMREHFDRAVYELRKPLVEAPPKAQKPFVCVYAEGTDVNSESRITFGTSGEAPGSLTLDPQVTLKDVRIIVFADMRLVTVQGFVVGRDYITACAGDCPSAVCPLWQVGYRGRVDVALRYP